MLFLDVRTCALWENMAKSVNLNADAKTVEHVIQKLVSASVKMAGLAQCVLTGVHLDSGVLIVPSLATAITELLAITSMAPVNVNLDLQEIG